MTPAKDCYDGGICRNDDLVNELETSNEQLGIHRDVLLDACKQAWPLIAEYVQGERGARVANLVADAIEMVEPDDCWCVLPEHSCETCRKKASEVSDG